MLSVSDVARLKAVDEKVVRLAIKRKHLSAEKVRNRWHIASRDAQRWKPPRRGRPKRSDEDRRVHRACVWFNARTWKVIDLLRQDGESMAEVVRRLVETHPEFD